VFGRQEMDEARTIVDESDEADLYQRLQDRGMPTLPASMTGAASGLVGMSLVLTLAAGPLVAYTDRAATDLLEREPYISAVLPEPLR
jgi:multicomponent Na+:H+ antiporter subunit D